MSAPGRDGEARAAAADLLRLQPDFALDYVDATYPFRDPADRGRFLDTLRRAGLLAAEP